MSLQQARAFHSNAAINLWQSFDNTIALLRLLLSFRRIEHFVYCHMTIRRWSWKWWVLVESVKNSLETGVCVSRNECGWQQRFICAVCAQYICQNTKPYSTRAPDSNSSTITFIDTINQPFVACVGRWGCWWHGFWSTFAAITALQLLCTPGSRAHMAILQECVRELWLQKKKHYLVLRGRKKKQTAKWQMNWKM